VIKIKRILSDVDSPFIKIFEEQTAKISEGSEQSENNLLFLQSLYMPCKKLEEATPREIPLLLIDLLNRVRMISEKSQYYNSSDKIQGLLHNISNEIIKRCKNQVKVSDMLDGDVEQCMQDL